MATYSVIGFPAHHEKHAVGCGHRTLGVVYLREREENRRHGRQSGLNGFFPETSKYELRRQRDEVDFSFQDLIQTLLESPRMETAVGIQKCQPRTFSVLGGYV